MIPFGVTAKQRLLNLMKCALRNILLETPSTSVWPSSLSSFNRPHNGRHPQLLKVRNSIHSERPRQPGGPAEGSFCFIRKSRVGGNGDRPSGQTPCAPGGQASVPACRELRGLQALPQAGPSPPGPAPASPLPLWPASSPGHAHWPQRPPRLPGSPEGHS